MAEFTWTAKKEAAALELALDNLSIEAIAKKVNLTDRAIYKWKKRPEFQARVEEHLKAIRQEMATVGILSKTVRARRLQKRFDQCNKAIEMQLAASNGMSVNAALVKEERELAKQAAQEAGQWTEKTDVTSGGAPLARAEVLIQLPDNGRDPQDVDSSGGTPA